jgi:hypothetical protein
MPEAAAADTRVASDEERLQRFMEMEEDVHALAYEARILAGASDDMFNGHGGAEVKISHHEAASLMYAINRLEELSGKLLLGYAH